MLGLLHIPFYYIKVPYPFSNNSRGSLEDIPEAFVQMWNNKLIILSLLGKLVKSYKNFSTILGLFYWCMKQYYVKGVFSFSSVWMINLITYILILLCFVLFICSCSVLLAARHKLNSLLVTQPYQGLNLLSK